MNRKKIKARRNTAKAVQTPMPPEMLKTYILPGPLRQNIIQALLTSTPRQFTLSQSNEILNGLTNLRELEALKQDGGASKPN